jgi:hypothetical protein
MERVYNHADSRQVATILNQFIQTMDGNTGAVTLANSATTTTVSNPKITSQSRIFLQARNANAVSAAAFVSTVSNGSFVITHTSAATERKFDYLIVIG